MVSIGVRVMTAGVPLLCSLMKNGEDSSGHWVIRHGLRMARAVSAHLLRRVISESAECTSGKAGCTVTPGAVVRTKWATAEIWLRRTFVLPEVPQGLLALSILHDEDAEVYINGVRAAKLTGYVTSYVQVDMSDPARRTLRPGGNTIAVHCSQTVGGQSIDVGLVRYVEK